MKSVLFAALLSLVIAVPSLAAIETGHGQSNISAKKGKGKGEPAPKDRDERTGDDEDKDPREETYEGNDRNSGGSFDGGGYSGGGYDGGGRGGGDGGMGSEIFFVPHAKTYPVTTNTKVEDRGDVLVYTTRTHEDISADETCTTVSVVVIAKATGKIISSETDEYCNRWPL